MGRVDRILTDYLIEDIQRRLERMEEGYDRDILAVTISVWESVQKIEANVFFRLGLWVAAHPKIAWTVGGLLLIGLVASNIEFYTKVFVNSVSGGVPLW